MLYNILYINIIQIHICICIYTNIHNKLDDKKEDLVENVNQMISSEMTSFLQINY